MPDGKKSTHDPKLKIDAMNKTDRNRVAIILDSLNSKIIDATIN